MSNTYFCEYDKLYPDLVLKILKYFEISNNAQEKVNEKSVLRFCESNKSGDQYIYQPVVINRICKRLCDAGMMDCLRNSGGLGLDNNYLFIAKDIEYFNSIDKSILSRYFNSLVYGFDYIYNMYKNTVIPLVWEKKDGDYASGTGFKIYNGIATAKHCIKDVVNLQIKGYKAAELEGRPVYISDNDGVDLAFIETGRVEESSFYCENGEVMQEVLVMGYPRIPAFTDFLTAEKATISSKASSRLTPTRGAIAAFGYEYLTNIEAMLITARIRGGNSGGPVINQNGSLVGITCHAPDADPKNGDYDDLGYGVAVPVSYLNDIVTKKSNQLIIPEGFYRDFD